MICLRTLLLLSAALVSLWGVSCRTHSPAANEPSVPTASPPLPFDPWSDLEKRQIASLSPLPSAPVDSSSGLPSTPAAQQLGQFLFFDMGLSDDGRRSCAFCHNPTLGFADGQRIGQGHEKLLRHTPAIWNVAHQRWLYWDGRADSLWMQALEPIEDPREMGGSRVAVVQRVGTHPPLRQAYTRVFGEYPKLLATAQLPEHARPTVDPEHPLGQAWATLTPEVQQAVNVVYSNVGRAIAAYEALIESRDSAFDRFVRGELEREHGTLNDSAPGDSAPGDSAFSDSARRGLRLFLGRGGCINCHNGPNFSDGEFHITGVPDSRRDGGRYSGIAKLRANPFNSAGVYSADPMGERGERVLATPQDPELFGAFKTPTLRHVALTSPYMHNGVYRSLREVLHFYNTLEGQQTNHHGETVLTPLGLNDSELSDLEEFLRSLIGARLPSRLLRAPKSPLLAEES